MGYLFVMFEAIIGGAIGGLIVFAISEIIERYK